MHSNVLIEERSGFGFLWSWIKKKKFPNSEWEKKKKSDFMQNKSGFNQSNHKSIKIDWKNY